MTKAQGQGSITPPPRSSGPIVTRVQRLRFSATLVVFVAWVAGLGLLAIRSDPPRTLSADDRAPGAAAAPDPREG
ncbi:hypothetical protein [Tautonia rosea]|uniref:hypothetical protein n=1 Tax=Tautonia rosea TaxID=2728037 RepID=UPI0014763636|nr:hypothetical protein [Tautonia rosea]